LAKEAKIRIKGQDNSRRAFDSHDGRMKRSAVATQLATKQMKAAWNSYLRLLKTGAVVAGAAAAATMAKSIQLAGVQEKAERMLADAFKKRGEAVESALAVSKEYASALQLQTTYGDEQILSVQEQLVRFGVLGDQLKELTADTLDLATAGKMDLRAAADLVGKAFVGYTGTLSRYGIIIDQNIPKSEQFAAAIAQIRERFGGAAVAELDTFSGKLSQLKNYFGDMLEEIGFLVVGLDDTEDLMGRIKDTLIEWTDWIKKNRDEIRKQAAELWDKLKPALDTVWGVLKPLGEFAIEHPDIIGEILVATVIAAATIELTGLAGAIGLVNTALLAVPAAGAAAGFGLAEFLKKHPKIARGLAETLPVGGSAESIRLQQLIADLQYQAEQRAGAGGGVVPGKFDTFPTWGIGGKGIGADAFTRAMQEARGGATAARATVPAVAGETSLPWWELQSYAQTGAKSDDYLKSLYGDVRKPMDVGQVRAAQWAEAISKDMADALAEYQEQLAEYRASVEGQMEAMLEGIGYTAANIASGIINTWRTVGDAIVDSFYGVKIDLEAIFKQIARNWMNLVVDQIGKEMFTSAEGGTGNGGGGFSLKSLLPYIPLLFMAGGGSFTATRPTPIIVGEGGRPEHVEVTPLGPGQGSGGMTANFYTIGDPRYLEKWLEDAGVRRVISGMVRNEMALGY